MSYRELTKLHGYDRRLAYLRDRAKGWRRATSKLADEFYRSAEWKQLRQYIIRRDGAWDLGVQDMGLDSAATVHHIDPVSDVDFIHRTKKLTDPDNLITTSLRTHNTIHFREREEEVWIGRKEGDTKLW